MNRRPYAILIATIFAALLLLFLHSIAEVLLLFFISVLFAIYLSAITDALQKRISVPRPIGLLVAVIITLFAVAGVVWLIVPPVLQQTTDLIQAMPALMARWEAQLLALTADSPFIGQVLGELEGGETYTGLIAAQIGGYFKGVVP